MIIIACGGRGYTGIYNKMRVNQALSLLHAQKGIERLIHGAARGADTLAAEWAEVRGIETEAFPVTKEDWLKHGKGAGHLRNKAMLIRLMDRDFLGRDIGVVAFPGGPGTANMIQQTEAEGLLVWRPFG